MKSSYGRKVAYYNTVEDREADLCEGAGVFHQFGVDWTECGNAYVNYSTAIIELKDGYLISHPVELVKFEDE